MLDVFEDVVWLVVVAVLVFVAIEGLIVYDRVQRHREAVRRLRHAREERWRRQLGRSERDPGEPVPWWEEEPRDPV